MGGESYVCMYVCMYVWDITLHNIKNRSFFFFFFFFNLKVLSYF